MILTKNECIKIMKRLRGVYTYANFCPDSEAMDTWYETLRLTGYPSEHIEKAVNLWIQQNDKPPTPANIVDYAKKIVTGEIKQEVKWRTWILIDNSTGDVMEEVCEKENLSVDDIAAWFKRAGYSLSGTIIKPMTVYEWKLERIRRKNEQIEEDRRKAFYG